MSIEYLPREWPDEAFFLLLIAKYREFRLQSLKLAPDAYASTYEREINFEPEVWRQRLTNPEAQHIVISRDTDRAMVPIENVAEAEIENKGKRISEQKWVGMIVIVERTTNSTVGERHPWKFNHATAIKDGEVTKTPRHNWTYQLNALFVHPSVRRLGYGEALVKSGIECVRMMAKRHSLSHANVSIMLDAWNEAARRLYEKNGFVQVSEEEFIVGDSRRKALTMLYSVSCESEVVEE